MKDCPWSFFDWMYKEYKYQLGSHENCSTSIFSFFKNGYNQKVLGVNTTPSMPLTIILPIQISINEGGTRSASLLGFIRPSFNYKKSWQPLTFPVSVVIRIANTIRTQISWSTPVLLRQFQLFPTGLWRNFLQSELQHDQIAVPICTGNSVLDFA